ncbi:hypothetical protein HY994_01620 [Candidatus Micrarchaeota archaeon]|nr:hypothetical protein [Candidatus Micrarchaeota archaeon]
MERLAKAIANNPHASVNLYSLGNGSNHVNIEINAKAPTNTTRGKTQLFQIHEALERAGVPHLHLGPEELDGSQVTFLHRLANRKPGRWGTIVIHTRSKVGGEALTDGEALKIRKLYQSLLTSGLKDKRIPNK